MKFIKENLFLVSIAAVVLVVGAILIVLTMGARSNYQARVDERTALAAEIRRVQVREPVNESINRAHRQHVDATRAEGQRVYAQAVAYNQRDYQVLQAEHDGQRIQAFPYNRQLLVERGGAVAIRHEYQRRLDELVRQLNPTTPPTEAEVAASIDDWRHNLTREYRTRALQEQEQQEREPATAPPVRPWSDPYGEEFYNEGPSRWGTPRQGPAATGLPPALEQELIAESQRRGRESAIRRRAEQGSMYVAPGALAAVTAFEIESGDPVALWQAQNSLWIKQDVINAILATNREAWGTETPRGVPYSAVKRLERIEVDSSYVAPEPDLEAAGPAQAPRGGSEMGYDEEWMMMGEEPYYGGEMPQARREVSAPVSLTGRTSNQMYDVIHYRFTVVMPTRHIPALIRNLQQINFHTVLEPTIRPVQARVQQTRGTNGMATSEDLYYYGIDGVREVEFVCEAVFLTAWTRGMQRVNPDTGATEWVRPPLMPVQILRDQLSGALRPEDRERVEASTPAAGRSAFGGQMY